MKMLIMERGPQEGGYGREFVGPFRAGSRQAAACLEKGLELIEWGPQLEGVQSYYAEAQFWWHDSVVATLEGEVAALRLRLALQQQVLGEVQEYLEGNFDIDDEGGPGRAMRLWQAAQAVMPGEGK